MGNLPYSRVNTSRPFANTGIDYCGPIELKMSKGRSPKTCKGYISIFVCMAVKAVHLEVVSDLTAETFLAAFKRFASRRGIPSKIYSDNGTTFVRANKELDRDLQRAIKEQQDEYIISTLSHQAIEWIFIPPAAPHHGGIWERGVRSVKHHLRRTIGGATLTFEEITTVLAQIEACLNSRPLYPLTSDPDDYQVLTPAHFLSGSSLLIPAEENITTMNEHRLRRWQYTQRLSQMFWKKWKNDYLQSLQTRPKWKSTTENIKVGQLALIKEDRLPPANWHIGRIEAVYPGKDNLVRVVDIRTTGNTYTRPITKICVLPIEVEEPNQD